MENTIRAALVNVIKARRLKLSRTQRSKGVKTMRWLYPLATENRYAASYRAWFRPLREYVHKYINENHEAILRGDSIDTDFRTDATVTVSRIDAVPGFSLQTMINSMNGWLAQNLPEDRAQGGGAIYMGLGNIAESVFDFNDIQFQKGAKSFLGVEFPAGEQWWPDARDIWANNNYQIIRSDLSRYVSQINTLTEQAVSTGASVKTLREQLQKLDDSISKKRAEFIARDQIGKLNGQITQQRQEDIGLTMYVWETAGDERVRSTHIPMDGALCRWDDSTVLSTDEGKTWQARPMGAVQLHPGMDYQCRCTATAFWQELVGEADSIIDEQEGFINPFNDPGDTATQMPEHQNLPEMIKNFINRVGQEVLSLDSETDYVRDMGIAAGNKIEFGTMILNNTILEAAQGKADYIEFKPETESKVFKAANNSVVLIHYHPSGSSFGQEDLGTFGSVQAFSEIRVTTADGKVFRIMRKPDSKIIKSYDTIEKEYIRQTDRVTEILSKRKGWNGLSKAEQDILISRGVSRILAVNYNWDYKETP